MVGRKLFATRQRRRGPRIEIIPMVDVMFLLLVFYILSSLALHKQQGIPVNLPQAQNTESASVPEDFVITITSAGEYYLDKQRVSGDHFSRELQSWAARLPGGVDSAQKVNVVLNAELTAQHQYVVTAMDELRQLGVSNFTISTEPARGRK